MEQRRFRFGAGAEPQRVRILSIWGLLGITVLVAVLLALLFPKQTLLEQVREDNGNDELTANYLTSLIRTDPHNAELRLLLAEKKYLLREPAAARELTAEIAAGPDKALRRRALMLDYTLGRNEAWAKPDAEARRLLAERLARMARENWPPKDLVYLMREARAVGAREVTALFTSRIADAASGFAPKVIAEAAQAALGDGEYAAASELLLIARRRADTPELRREYYRGAVAALQAGNKPAEALALAEANIGELEGDDATLLYLARLALAAGNPAKAQVYMRRLLRLSDSAKPSPVERLVAALGDLLIGSAHAQTSSPAAASTSSATSAPTPGKPAPLRPYDEELYNLAYEVFLGNSNLKDSFRVAEAAVAQRPHDLRWRERLAQVAEWSGQPQEALRQWVQLAKLTGREAAYQSVLRLAPGLFDYESLLFAWRHVITQRALTRAELVQLVDTFESAGEVDAGIGFFEDYYKRRTDPVALEQLAMLNERAGRIDATISAYERLIAASGPSPERLVSLATLKLSRADLPGAFALLAGRRAQVPVSNEAYWRLLGDLAWELQEDEVGREAYRLLAAGDKPEPDDLLRLVLLLRATQPLEAARVAEAAWQRHRNVQALTLAVELRTTLGDRNALRRLYATIAQGDEKLFNDNRYFFTQRATFRAADGDRSGALADWRYAILLAPQDLEQRAGFLWFLIDGKMNPELRREVVSIAPAQRDAPELLDPLGAAWLTLGEPRQALAYFRRQAKAKSGDYLWLMNYADTLEAAGEEGMALRMRRHAWETVRRAPDPKTVTKDRERLITYVRLVTQFAPGDPSLAAIRHVLRQDNAADAAPSKDGAGTTDATAQVTAQVTALSRDAAVRELVLAWAISTESNEAARAWRWNAYGRKFAAPAWAEVSLAIERRDTDALNKLLETQADSLPTLARIDAARETQQLRLAQQLGFAAQEKSPNDDEIHLRLATDLLASASSVIVDDKLLERGVLKGRERSVRAQVWLSPKLRLSTQLVVLHQRTTDPTQFTGVPGTDRALNVSALMRHDRGDTELSLGQRSGVSDFTTVKLSHNRPLGERVSASAALSMRERAGETLALYVGGHKDEASLAGQWNISRREYLSARAWGARFHTQQETWVGTGRGLFIEAGHRIRSEYPDWNVRLTRALSHYETADATDARSAELNPAAVIPAGNFFLPQSSKTWGISTGFGMDMRERYGRGIRPFGDIGRSVNSITGSGYNWLLGAGGSLFGQDYLSIYSSRSKGGAGTNLAIREVGLRYQYFFDRF